MKFRLVEHFDDVLLEGRKSVIEPGSDLEKNLIYDIEHTDISFNELTKKYGLNSKDPIYTLIKRLNLNPVPRPQNIPKIKPGSELEKELIYDIENTDTPYVELVKKYGLNSKDPIHTLIKRLNLNVIPRTSAIKPSVIEPGSDLEKAILNDIKYTDKSLRQIGKERGIDSSVLSRLAQKHKLPTIRKDARGKQHVYFNTLEADIQHVKIDHIEAELQFRPSIYLGQYPITIVQSMYEYISKKYFMGRVNTTGLIEFYLKLASNEISLNTLIAELKDQSNPAKYVSHLNFDYKFITISTEELSTVDFYSANYTQLAKDFLTFLSRKDSSRSDFDTVYKDLIAAADKVDSETSDRINQTNTYIRNNLETIAHNIYSKKGDVIEATNYINEIPYETSFDVSSPQDIASYMKQYNGYLLYGFMNNTGDIVYIGISLNATSRGKLYKKENRPLILKAFEDGIIKKLIIFKSNLPIQSRSVNTKLIYALEVYFAEHLFKTYPANYPKALNKARPGQNSSTIIASQNRQKFETYISNQGSLLSIEEFTSAGKEILDVGAVRLQQLYPYLNYAKDYIVKHHGDLSMKDKQALYISLRPSDKHVLWDICSSESEYREIISHVVRHPTPVVNNWKNYRIENNLPITEDLDDAIDTEYYV